MSRFPYHFPKAKNSIFSYAIQERSYLGLATGTISINKGAFKNCFELEEVLISDSVNLISNGAFANCINLCNVDMPDSLAIIRFAAFSECKKLKSIMIPKGVVRIEGWAFAGCDSLTKIEVSKENSYYRSYREKGRVG